MLLGHGCAEVTADWDGGGGIDGPAADLLTDMGIWDLARPDMDRTIPGKWVTLPAGTFYAGYKKDQPCGGLDSPAIFHHKVTLTRSFEIMAHEVTQGDYFRVTGARPSHFNACGDACPVESVSWYMAALYANALSYRAGLEVCYACSGDKADFKCDVAPGFRAPATRTIYDCPGYRLPTDAEWEYAYRAGTTTGYHNGEECTYPGGSGCYKDSKLEDIAWYCDNAAATPHPVGGKKANAWGLYDMAGNVYEWVNDVPETNKAPGELTDPPGNPVNYKIRGRRGGSWTKQPANCTAFYNYAKNEYWYWNDVGFRIARTMTKGP